jgi:hypothetical protein
MERRGPTRATVAIDLLTGVLFLIGALRFARWGDETGAVLYGATATCFLFLAVGAALSLRHKRL